MIQPPRSIVKNSSMKPKIQLSRAKALKEKSTTSPRKIVLPKKTLKTTTSSQTKSIKSKNQVPDITKKILPITPKISTLKPIEIKTNKVQSTKEILKPESDKSLKQASKTPITKVAVPITINKIKQKLPNKKSPIIKPISNTISALTLEKDDNTTPSTLTKIFAAYYTFVITETSNKIPEPLELHVAKELLSKLFTEKDNKYTSISEYLIATGKKHKIEIKEITLAEFRKYILKISTIAEKGWINIKPENNMEKLLIKLLKNKI